MLTGREWLLFKILFWGLGYDFWGLTSAVKRTNTGSIDQGRFWGRLWWKGMLKWSRRPVPQGKLSFLANRHWSSIFQFICFVYYFFSFVCFPQVIITVYTEFNFSDYLKEISVVEIANTYQVTDTQRGKPSNLPRHGL